MTSDSTHSHPPSAHATTLTYTYCQILSHTGDKFQMPIEVERKKHWGGEGDQSITGNEDL